MRQRSGRDNETGQELRIRLDHVLGDLTPAQRIDLAMVLMAEGVAVLKRDNAAHVWPPPDLPPSTTIPVALLTVNQASKRYQLGRSRLYELIGSGALPSIKLGRRRLIRAETLEAWLIEQEH